jgi:hypothetical protein
MKRLGLILLLGLALAACGRTPKPAPPAAPPTAASRTIFYKAGPCKGPCPVFEITVYSNHSGKFTGIQHTLLEGEALFPVLDSQYDAFAAALAPYRPRGERRIEPGSADCPRHRTDMPSVEVRWGDGAKADRLYLYFGCDGAANRAMADALGNAPDLLPLDLLLGDRP